MCGNDISSVSNPNSDFYALVSTQVPSRKIVIKNYPINLGHTSQLGTLNLATIKELSLQKCNINHETMQHLGQISLPMLVKLNLSNNELGPIGCRILGSSPMMSNLLQLSLNNNKIKDVGLKALANGDLQFIEDLSLNENSLTSEGLKALNGKLESIECLSLGSNKLNDSSVAALNALNLSTVYFLKLSRNQITEQGLRSLISGFRNLDVLLIERNKIKQDKEKFKRKDLFLFY